ncbi:hypothetical protein [Alicyclobacillus sp. SO9]|nr:hypothetical protein [Alicyclobacillus sp. SO9]
MRRYFLILMVIALVIVAYETFKPQPAFPSANAASAAAVTTTIR